MLISLMSGATVDIDTFLSLTYGADGIRNYSRLSDPVIEELIHAQRQTLDPEKRKAIIHELDRYIAERAYVVPLPGVRLVQAHSGMVQDFAFQPGPDLGAMLERVWLGENITPPPPFPTSTPTSLPVPGPGGIINEVGSVGGVHWGRGFIAHSKVFDFGTGTHYYSQRNNTGGYFYSAPGSQSPQTSTADTVLFAKIRSHSICASDAPGYLGVTSGQLASLEQLPYSAHHSIAFWSAQYAECYDGLLLAFQQGELYGLIEPYQWTRTVACNSTGGTASRASPTSR